MLKVLLFMIEDSVLTRNDENVYLLRQKLARVLPKKYFGLFFSIELFLKLSLTLFFLTISQYSLSKLESDWVLKKLLKVVWLGSYVRKEDIGFSRSSLCALLVFYCDPILPWVFRINFNYIFDYIELNFIFML